MGGNIALKLVQGEHVLTQPPEDEEDADLPTAAGGTLFERMSNIARGAPKAQIDEDEPEYKRDPIDIPRFLNRQNNQ